MELPVISLIIMGPVMVLALVLGWRYFMAADKRELEEHERALQAQAARDSNAKSPK
ncbi:MAG: hypothetical protein ACO1SX_22420 [Actinomycetota bacterium]